MSAIWLSSLLAAFVLITLTVIVWRALRSGRSKDVSVEWLTKFRPERYRPLERLLSDSDFRFIEGQPGYDPRIARRLRRRRIEVFRRYLKQMERDFRRLHAIGRMMVVYSSQDRPDLAAVLFRQSLLFRYALLRVHVSLLLYSLGFNTVDVSGLIRGFERLSETVRQPLSGNGSLTAVV